MGIILAFKRVDQSLVSETLDMKARAPLEAVLSHGLAGEE
jgi:hypothetical protein